MKIIIAKTAGFCMGVHRAVNIAVETAAKTEKHIYTLGPLIHNNQTLEMLIERGVTILDEKNPPGADSIILIRAHGIPPQRQEEYEAKKYPLIDGTCPKVKTVHKVIEKYRRDGFSIVITGDQGHAEVVGLSGYAGDTGYIIHSVEDVKTLPEFQKVCCVSQTTFNGKTFDEIAESIKKRYPQAQVVIKKTICAATEKRQEEIKKLAQQTDAIIVVGGKNSANTIRLADIAKESGTPTWHIETEQELAWNQISRFKTIGISAGASTPNWMIKRTVNHLYFLERTNRNTFANRLSNIFEILANINFFVAAGGVAMYYASSILQEIPFAPPGAILTFLYLVSIYLWNSLAVIEKSKHLDISRYQFYNANKANLTILALSCIAILLGISLFYSAKLFGFMLIPTLAGSVYNFTIVPKRLQKLLKYKNLKDIPTSRDLFAALAWAVLITFTPQAINDDFVLQPASGAIFLWTFFLAYLRSLIFDLRDIEGDRIMGRETLITIIGEIRVKALIFTALFSSLFILICLAVLTLLPDFRLSNVPAYAFLLQIPVLLHVWAFMKYQQNITNSFPALFNLLADGQFYIAGFGAWLISLFGN